jgi:AcrR family transcriptional regulator
MRNPSCSQNMTQSSRSSTPKSSPPKSSPLRRQPKQQRSKERVEAILDAAAAVFDRLGYDAATTHQIAAEAEVAIGSLYQFFPDKAAIFRAMELRHWERVRVMWAATDVAAIAQLPLREMIRLLVQSVVTLFENPVSRVVFIQFFVAREIFQEIDDGMTQEAIHFMANILRQRNPQLAAAQLQMLAEVCVTTSNALTLSILRNPDRNYQIQMQQEVENLLVGYLMPHMGQEEMSYVMKVMKCPHCRSAQLSRNGYRRGKQCYLCKDCGKQFVQAVTSS